MANNRNAIKRTIKCHSTTLLFEPLQADEKQTWFLCYKWGKSDCGFISVVRSELNGCGVCFWDKRREHVWRLL